MRYEGQMNIERRR